MTDNMDRIMDKLDPTTLSILQDAGIDEALLRTLTQEDLKEVFPDRADFGRRKRLWALIHPENENPQDKAGPVGSRPSSPSRTSVFSPAPHSRTSSFSPEPTSRTASVSPEAPTTSTALKSPKRRLQLPPPPEYVVYSDSELEQTRKRYHELSLTGREGEVVMSKDLRCRLVRNTVTSMVAILRACEGQKRRYPSREELTLMAERIVECYPMLQDKDNPVKHDTMLGFLRKRLANVQTPVKRQGPTPKRGVPKKRRLSFSPLDDGSSGSGSTIILSPSTETSGDLGSPAPDDGPDGPGSSEESQLVEVDSVEDSREAQASHYKTLQELLKRPKPNQRDVAQLLELEFEARRAFIDSDETLHEEDRPAKILEAYPCFKDLQHVKDEMRRILAKDNPNFTDEVKKRWDGFCAQVQYYSVWKKIIKPRFPLDGVEFAIGIIKALPALFPSSSPPPKKLGGPSEALLHILEPSEDPNLYLQKRPLQSPVLILDRPHCLVAVGNTPITTFPEEKLIDGLIYLLGYYYTFHLTYPKCVTTLLSVVQTEVLCDDMHDRDATPSYKKALAEWKTFVDGR